MPTGYTQGILDGKITTFPQFAKLCMRAFGATIHMRDESLEAEYEPRVVGDYHKDKLRDANLLLDFIKGLSDKELIDKKRGELEDDVRRYDGYIITAKENEVRLREILDKVINWEPPTKEHDNIKSFMIEQIEKTIDFDCKCEYYLTEREKANTALHFLKAEEIRKEYIDKANWEINYHTEQLNAEIKRVEESNNWVNKLLESF